MVNSSRRSSSESVVSRILRRVREEPLVPLGMLLTCGALVGAGRAMKANDHVRANIMFRRRLYAQGFTLLCVVAGGMYWRQDRARRRQFDQLEKDRCERERRERWLVELERRDQEDRQAKRRVDDMRQRRTEREADIRRRVRTQVAAEQSLLSEDSFDAFTPANDPSESSPMDSPSTQNQSSLTEQATRSLSDRET